MEHDIPLIASEFIQDLPEGWSVTMDTAAIPDGREKKGVRLHRSHSVNIIPVLPNGNIVLLREYRPFIGAYVWLIPGGKVDKESDLIAAAQRELQEEAGYEAAHIEPFGRYFLNDVLSIRNHIFIATGLTPNQLTQDEDELIEAHEMPLDEAIDKVCSCDPIHAISAACLLRYKNDRMGEKISR